VSGAAPALRSIKLRPAEARARVVPAADAAGCAFAGPGVDVLGADAVALVAAAAPVFAWFDALEPGVRVRTIAFDFVRERVIANVENSARPRVVKVEAPASADLFARARPLATLALRFAHARLAHRSG
jgi:hypothetical protein